MTAKKWITPFKKQSFVTLGVVLNTSAYGLTMGFSGILLPQLRRTGSVIEINDTSGSWIASILGSSLVAGNILAVTVMAKCGRKIANIAAILPVLVGWFIISTATSITMLLVARFLQGISIGMSSTIGPVLIGEYTSPQNRGAFLTTIALSIASGVLTVHTLGSYLTWQTTALVCAFIAFVDLLVVMYSPESPSWLANQGRYDESKRVFRWLRGLGEKDELVKMIEANKINREMKMDNSSHSFNKKFGIALKYFTSTIRKKEFYKPIFIMMHIYTMGQWAGANVISAYSTDIYSKLITSSPDILPIIIISVDIQRIISNSCAVYVIRKVKRRTMLLVTIGMNVVIFFTIAGYTYAKTHDTLPFDHAAIGIALIHIHMFTIATGTVPLPYIIAGEVFPLEYRSLAGGVSVIFFAINVFLTVKTFPFLFNQFGLHGTYCIYAAIVMYNLLVAWKFLPETKDRTLQDIEDVFRGGPPSPGGAKSLESLTASKLCNSMGRKG